MLPRIYEVHLVTFPRRLPTCHQKNVHFLPRSTDVSILNLKLVEVERSSLHRFSDGPDSTVIFVQILINSLVLTNIIQLCNLI